MPLTLSAINIYPIKSMGGIALKEAYLSDRGLQYDRRWMLVRPDGQFLTQRQLPQMVWLEVQIKGASMWIRHKKKEIEPLEISLSPAPSESLQVRVFSDTCLAWLPDKAADQWFSKALDSNCRLAYMPDESQRLIDPDFSRKENEVVSFADGYPCLIIGQATLDELNRRLDKPVPMSRFRPNFVYTGGKPHEEDDWSAIRMGNVPFFAVKKCARCQIPTVDPETATFQKEPTRTLATYRRTDNKIHFGMNLLLGGKGKVKVGDIIEMQ